jgi:UDP-glucose 4-epimerase
MTDTILVLGASGFIGRHLVHTLAQKGRRVIAATRSPAVFDHPLVRNAVAPFDNADHFSALLAGCCVVIHAATSSTPSTTAKDPTSELEANLRATFALLTALQSHPHAQLLFLSSAGTVYGDCGAESAGEDHALKPRSYHGAAKLAAEHFIHAWTNQHGGSATVLRPSNVYGPGQLPRRGFGVIPAAFNSALQGSPFTLWGDGKSTRDYLYIDDLLQAAELALDASPGPGTMEVYNVSSGTGVGLLELLDTIDAVTGRPIIRRIEPARSADIHNVAPDNRKAMAALNWTPTVGLKQGLGSTWQWFISQH